MGAGALIDVEEKLLEGPEVWEHRGATVADFAGTENLEEAAVK